MFHKEEKHIPVIYKAQASLQEGISYIKIKIFSSISHLVLQKKYVVVKEKMNYAGSLAHCKSLGGSLALPESPEENQQMLDELGNGMKLLFRSVLSFAAESHDTFVDFWWLSKLS